MARNKKYGIIGLTDLLRVAQTLRAEIKPILDFGRGVRMATVTELLYRFASFVHRLCAKMEIGRFEVLGLCEQFLFSPFLGWLRTLFAWGSEGVDLQSATESSPVGRVLAPRQAAAATRCSRISSTMLENPLNGAVGSRNPPRPQPTFPPPTSGGEHSLI